MAALQRGDGRTRPIVSLAVVIIACLAFFGLAYVFYGRFVAQRLGIDPCRPTPAHTENDGVDYVPTKPLVLFGHHFSSIAGAGPIVGPIIAGLAFGWVPALLWIVLGAVLIGGVHDFTTLMASVRHKGRTIGQVCKHYLSPAAYYLLLIFTWVAMIYVMIVFLDLTATSYAPAEAALRTQGGSVATASVLYIFLAVAFGLVVYRTKLTLASASLIFVPLVFGALWLGQVMPMTAEKVVPALLGSAKNTWSVILLVYCFVASMLPVWVLLQPRDYLSAFLLVGCLVGGVAGAIISGFGGQAAVSYPAFTTFRDVNLGYLYPALFITVACGAISGFHCLVASGTTSKQLDSERAARPVAYGGMLTEGVLAVLSLSAVMILASRPQGQTPVGVFASGIGGFLSVIGLSREVGTTFALLAVSTFLLTTLDTCTRLARFILQELFQLKGRMGRLTATVATLAVPALMIFVEIPGPQGQPIPAWKAIWPAFGATNQLLGAFGLLVVYTWLKHAGKKTVYVFVPMLFMCVTALTALVQLVAQNLLGKGSLFIGWVSLGLALLAVALIVNAFWRLRKVSAGTLPPKTAPVTETA